MSGGSIYKNKHKMFLMIIYNDEKFKGKCCLDHALTEPQNSLEE